MFNINFLQYMYIPQDGYGRFGMALLNALLETGNVEAYHDTVGLFQLPGWLQRYKGFDHTNPTLAIMPPHELPRTGSRNFLYTMYESSHLPKAWPQHVNEKVQHLIVPCEWNKRVFEDAGCEVPIHVIHGGTDVVENAVLPKRKIGSRPYTFMALGDRGARKGWDVAWTAFCKAFRPEDDVRMIVKARPMNLTEFNHSGSADPMSRKLSIWREDVANMRDVFAWADCVVYPTRSEGWGMWPREAAACGLPVIATNFGGTAVGCEHWAYPLNDYVMRRSAIPVDNPGGQWAMVNSDEVAEWMRYCYENREDAQAKGTAAAQWIRENQTWQHTAQKVLSLMMYEEIYKAEEIAQIRAMHDRLIEKQTQAFVERALKGG